MDELIKLVSDQLTEWGVGSTQIRLLTTISSVILTLALCWMLFELLNRVIGKYVSRLVAYTEVKWDDVVFNPRVLKGIWQVITATIISATLPDCFLHYQNIQSFVEGLCRIIVVISWVVLIVRAIRAFFDLFSTVDRFSANSFNGISQLFQLLTICGGIIVIVSILIGRDPLFVLSGLGAMAAVLMLVFQDTILGFAAGIQLSANNMLRPGDWITAPKSNANGTVLEVNLTTVKIQNFDMTIVTIPPSTLVKDSFQNWRGMRESGGRRVMRSFSVDMTSVRFCTATEIDAFSKQPWWQPSFMPKEGEKAVNLTLFRRYLEWYIGNLPTLNTDMTRMIRELQPTPEGLPIEVYFFTREQKWENYEMVQAAMLDHSHAVVNRFGLVIFQRPTGTDIRQIPHA